jgi:hypothetical protein
MSTFSGGADSETLEHPDYFLSLAEIAVALAGFAGLIVAIAGRQDRSGEDARLDVEFLKNVLWASFMAIAFALLPATLLNMGWIQRERFDTRAAPLRLSSRRTRSFMFRVRWRPIACRPEGYLPAIY